MPLKSTKTPRVSRTKITKAEHGTSVGSAFQQIRELVVHGKLAPGTWIVEGDLCEHLQMSRTPVRGALYLLQREGYVIEHRNGSKSRMVVAPLTKDDAQELYPIIGRIEGLAGRRAAALAPSVRQDLVGRLRHVNGKLEKISREQSYNGPDIFDLDHEFHHLLVTAGSGPRLKALHQAIEPQTERYWRLYASSIIGQLHLSVWSAGNCALHKLGERLSASCQGHRYLRGTRQLVGGSARDRFAALDAVDQTENPQRILGLQLCRNQEFGKTLKTDGARKPID
jgi:DNA-binding GntR family transcriptional regulator